MAHDIQTITETRFNEGHVLVKLRDSINPNDILDALHGFFEKLFNDGVKQIVFDMGNIPFPSGSFIALLIAKTEEARFYGGDMQIVNLLDTARNNFSFFTPLTFLSIVSNGEKIAPAAESVQPIPAGSESGDLVIEEGERPRRMRIMANVDALQDVTDFVTVWARDDRITPTAQSKLRIAVYEACMNVIEHGYQFEEGHEIEVEVIPEETRFMVKISDWGVPFEKFGRSDYNVQEAFEKRLRGGYGFYIIQQSVDEIRYEFGEGGNCLTLILEFGVPE
ncbi:ATP-binding protein [bacterium]|nr:ATP-binding protein [bacterium]